MTSLGDNDQEEASARRTLHSRVVARFPSFSDSLAHLDGVVVGILIAASFLLIIFRRFGDSNTFEQHLRPDALASHPHLSVYGDYYWFLASFVLLGLIPLAFLAIVPGARPRSFGLGIGDWRFGILWSGILFVVMGTVVAIVARDDLFANYYPLNDHMGSEAAAWLTEKGSVHDDFVATFLAYELLYAVYFLGWEWFFRGFLTFGLYDRIGVNGVFIGTIPFALMHVNKPLPEALGSIIAGVALGIFALRARSFWYPWALHVAIAWSMDFWAIAVRAARLG